jgi:hypothetical protein
MILINVVAAAASLYIIYTALVAFNHMTAATDLRIRIGYLAVTLGASCELVWSFDISHDVNRILTALFIVGVAIFFHVTRRRPRPC